MKHAPLDDFDNLNLPQNDPFIELTSYSYATDAELHILRNSLDEQNIEFYEKDAMTIAADPLLSNAIGGLKIMVRQSNEVDAHDVLTTVRQQLGTEITHSESGNWIIKALYATILSIILWCLIRAFSE
jgi:hypothetical protein